ncbi:MAG: YgeY family selenium metabolism-linked hydrolase, partial [Bacteroidetes bacterium]|nr:YgeY family selenium metabolism-linked hydrolase [Bacteroidota bacterium]
MTIAEQINAKAKEYRNFTAENLSRIIKMKSLSGGEKEVASAIKQMMEQAGFDEARIDGLGNVIGRIG